MLELTKEEIRSTLVTLTEKINPLLALHAKLTEMMNAPDSTAGITPPPKIPVPPIEPPPPGEAEPVPTTEPG